MKNGRRVIVAMAFVAIGGLWNRSVRAGFCPYWGCGGNAATVGDGIAFDELNVAGLTDDSGIRIRSVTLPDGTPGRLQVKGHHLIAKGASASQSLQGAKLVGTIITVAHSDGRAYQLKISEAVDGCDKGDPNCLKFWATPDGEVPNYKFLVKKISQRFEPTPPGQRCEDDRPVDSDFKDPICLGKNLEADLWKGVELRGLVFEGDYYDPHTKDVRKGRPGWFNLACAGTASAKMHLLRHTEAGSIKKGPLPRVTSMGDRTAMLRMITADYCGNGSTFTINGQPLLYGDVKRWYPKPPVTTNASDPRVRSFEAAWGPKGPLCLTEPRRFCKTIVQNICSTELNRPWPLPPPCPTNGTLPPGTHVLSANPNPTGAAKPPACINHWP